MKSTLRWLSLQLAAIAVFACVIFLGRVVLLWQNHALLADIGYSDLFAGYWVDIATACRLLALPLLLVWLPIPKLRASKTWWRLISLCSWLLLCFAVVVLLADAVYFAQGQKHISYEIVYFSDDLPLYAYLALHDYLGLSVLFIVVAVLALLLIFKYAPKTYVVPPYWLHLLILPVLCMALVFGFRGFRLAGKTLHTNHVYSSYGLQRGHVLVNGVLSISAALDDFHDMQPLQYFTQQQIIALEKQRGISEQAPFATTIQPTLAKPANVVVILLESWGKQWLDSYGAQQALTPEFDKIAAQSLLFSNGYAAGQRSIEALQAVLFGIPRSPATPPLGKGLSGFAMDSIGELAQRQGYATLFVQSASKHTYNINEVVLNNGFDYAYHRQDIPMELPYADDNITGWDYEMFNTLLKEIPHDTPFLAVAFTGTTHEPFALMPVEHQLIPGNSTPARFANTLHYADWSLGQFFSKARLQPWFDNTVFILIADHTKFAPSAATQQQRIVNLFAIPFIVYAPQLIGARIDNSVRGQVEIYPTVADLLHYRLSINAFAGSLLQPSKNNRALIYYAQRLGAITQSGVTTATAQFGKQTIQLQQTLKLYEQLISTMILTNTWLRQ